MAKGNRFPSDANKKKGAAAKAEAAPAVEGAKQDLVQVEYKKDNHHILSGVHALRQGVNHLPRSVWEEAKKHPSIQSMMASGHIVGPEDEEIEEAAEAADAQEAAEATEAPASA